LVLALVATIPFASLAACNGDNTQQTDSGPQNGNDSGNKQDVAQQQDTGTQNDASSNPDAPDPCSTGLKFDNTLVPGYPNNIPQP
jgi:hypothetical protein